jgi:hypothetical protein
VGRARSHLDTDDSMLTQGYVRIDGDGHRGTTEARVRMNQESRGRLYVAAAAIAAVAGVVGTVIQLTNPTFDSEFTTTVDWVNEVTFTLFIAASMVAMWGMVREQIASRVGGMVFIAGQGLLLAGMLPGFALGYSPDWFVVVGLPGNLLALIGMTLIAVYSWRRRTLPRVIAVLLPLSVLIGIGAAEFGGGIVIAIVWGAIAMRLSESTTEVAAATA